MSRLTVTDLTTPQDDAAIRSIEHISDLIQGLIERAYELGQTEKEEELQPQLDELEELKGKL